MYLHEHLIDRYILIIVFYQNCFGCPFDYNQQMYHFRHNCLYVVYQLYHRMQWIIYLQSNNDERNSNQMIIYSFI